MRPSKKPTGEVWRLLVAWRDQHPWKPKQGQMAQNFGVSEQLLSNWKYGESVMQAAEMRTVSQITGIDIGDLAAAVEADHRRRVMGNAEHPAPMNPAARDVGHKPKGERPDLDL